jgi:Pyridoxal-phosphate dependent enzyme
VLRNSCATCCSKWHRCFSELVNCMTPALDGFPFPTLEFYDNRFCLAGRFFISISPPVEMIRLTCVDVHRALSLIEDDIFRTPVIKSTRLTKFLSQCLTIDRTIQVFVKCENLQKSGSFKYRGALHSVLHLSDEQLRKGVVTYSTGKSFVRTFQCVLG